MAEGGYYGGERTMAALPKCSLLATWHPSKWRNQFPICIPIRALACLYKSKLALLTTSTTAPAEYPPTFQSTKYLPRHNPITSTNSHTPLHPLSSSSSRQALLWIVPLPSLLYTYLPISIQKLLYVIFTYINIQLSTSNPPSKKEEVHCGEPNITLK